MACTAFYKLLPVQRTASCSQRTIKLREHELFPELHIDLIAQRLHIGRGDNH